MDGYYAFMLVATAFVLMMTVPALALFYGGMSRSKSVLNMMMMSFVAAAIVGILYVAVGWSMGFGGDGTFFANPFELLWLEGVTTDNYIYVMFQMTFAIITAALISGAVADRLKFSAWVVFVPAVGPHRLLPAGPHGVQLHRGLAHLWPHRRAGLRRRHGGPHQRRCRGPGARAPARQAHRLAQGPDASAQPDADDARRGHAVARLVRLQRRLDRLRHDLRRGPRRVPRAVLLRDRPHLRQHHARHLRRDPRLAAHRAAAARQGHLARCRVRHRRGPGRHHPGGRCRRHRRRRRHRRDRRWRLRLGRQPEVQARATTTRSTWSASTWSAASSAPC